MSVVNAGVVRGTLELEDEFGDTLRDFDKQLSAAKEEAQATSTAVKGTGNAIDDFMASMHNPALEKFVRELSDEELAARDAAESLKLGVSAQKSLGDATENSTKSLKEQVKDIKAIENAARDEAKVMEFAAKQHQNSFTQMEAGLNSVKSSISGFRNLMVTQFAVQHIQQFVGEVVAMGSEIQDMSDRMGVGVEAAQELKYAITQTGGSLGDATTAINKMNDSLTEGKKGTLTALGKMNLQIDDLRRMKPEDAFEKIAEAIHDIPDPMEQTQAAMELFGKSGAKWLPAIRQGMGELRDEAQKMGQVLSKDDVAALDEFGDKYDQTMLRLKVGAASAILDITKAFKQGWSTILADQEIAFKAMIKSMSFKDFDPLSMIGKTIGGGLAVSSNRTKEQQRDAAREEFLKHHNDLTGNQQYADLPGLDPAALKKQQAEAAKAAKEIKASMDKILGKDMQKQITETRQQWKMLSTEQKSNKDIVQRLLAPYEDIRKKLDTLPPDLENIRNEMGKRLPATNLMTSFNGDLIQITKSINTAGVQTVNMQNLLEGLRNDGLLPVTHAFVGYAEAIDASEIKSRALITTIPKIKGAFEDAFDAQFGQRIVDSFLAGFEQGGFKQGITNIAKEFTATMSDAVTQSAIHSLGAVAGGIVGAGAGAILSYASTTIADYFNHDDVTAARDQVKQMYDDILQQFNGSREQMVKALQRAGLAQRQITGVDNLVTNTESDKDNPQQLARAWETARAALMQYQKELHGLGSILEGAMNIGAGLFKQTDQLAQDATKRMVEAQQAAIAAMEERGATDAEITAQEAKNAEDLKHVHIDITQDQIDQYDKLGVIAGGAIANIAGRTGDLVGAFQQSAPLLDQLIKIKEESGLAADQLSPATNEVLRFYQVVKDNADVFQSAQGVGQVLTGMGEAGLRSTQMINALGDTMAENIQTMLERGQTAEEVYAEFSPQLQQLWEVWKEGKVTVDDTTAAMLKEAETHGVVGESMKEIKSMFEDELPHAIARTDEAAQRQATNTSNAQKRLAQDTADANRDAAQQTQDVWGYAGHAITREQQAQLEIQTREAKKAALEQANNVVEAQNRIPKHIPIDIQWKVPPVELPTPEPYQVPVEFQMPNGHMPWDEGYTPPGGGAPHYPGPTPPTSNPASFSDRATAATAPSGGNTTIVLQDAGRPLLQFTVENTPGYVSLRAGSRVETTVS
jgi:hypothetical protein